MPSMQTPEPATDGTPDVTLFDTDIPDPAVPLAILADQLARQTDAATVSPTTLEGQVAMEVNAALYAFSQHAATVLANIDKSWDAALRVLDHKNSVLHCLAESLQNHATVTPFAATVQAVTPSGFPITFQVQHATAEGFDRALTTLFQWLKTEGFRP